MQANSLCSEAFACKQAPTKDKHPKSSPSTQQALPCGRLLAGEQPLLRAPRLQASSHKRQTPQTRTLHPTSTALWEAACRRTAFAPRPSLASKLPQKTNIPNPHPPLNKHCLVGGCLQANSLCAEPLACKQAPTKDKHPKSAPPLNRHCLVGGCLQANSLCSEALACKQVPTKNKHSKSAASPQQAQPCGRLLAGERPLRRALPPRKRTPRQDKIRDQSVSTSKSLSLSAIIARHITRRRLVRRCSPASTASTAL